MTEPEWASERIREAAEAIAEERVSELVQQARAEAEARVRARLTAEFEAALYERAGAALAREKPAPTPRRRAPAPKRREAEPAKPPEPTEATEPEEAVPMEPGFYVYGVAAADGFELPEGLAGVDPEHSTATLEQDGLVAVASRVSLAEFGEEALHENLNDVEWLEEKARAHEHVLDQILARAPVVPMRLCTIYQDEAHVREMLEREHDVFVDALHRLEGKTEWGVKLIAEPGALERAADESAEAGAESRDELSAGAAYMREKSRAARRRERIDHIAEAWAEDVHDGIARQAVEALLNPLQNPEVSGHTGDMLLNGVYLVEDRAAGEFHAAIEALATEYRSRGAGVELTGPWPPYNFVKGSIEAAR
jgi:gas vesicle protein GvpL/GvpF